MASSTNQTDAARPQDPEIQDGKFFAAIGYLNILCFVPLYLKKGNKFAQFHGKQALVLFILEMAAGIISIVPAVGDLISRFAFVVFGILSIVGILKVLMEEYWEMPVVYEISTRINL
jgi:fumarate reductase subunit D